MKLTSIKTPILATVGRQKVIDYLYLLIPRGLQKLLSMESIIPIAFSNYRNEHGKLDIRPRRNDE